MKKLLVLLLFSFGYSAFAAKPIPGLIPRFYSIEAATDLTVSASEAHARAVRGEDISLISPIANTNIWDSNKSEISSSKLLTHNKVSYYSSLASRLGKLRFTVRDEINGFVNLILSKKIHNVLLRKNILEKLGYTVPKIEYLKTVHIDFESKIDKELFIESMQDELLADPKRWIQEEGELHLVLKDLIAKEAKSNIYDLSLGIMPRNIHRGRRLLKAPYMALSLVDTPESVNLFPWEAGRVVLNQIKLNHTNDLARTYNTSFEDARWIMRKAAKLSRLDWEEIVQKAYYPKAVELLLVEKIINRRNDALKLLQLDEFPVLEINENVSYTEDLVDGELTREFFEGYVSRYSFGDPESPFSSSEIGAYALSRVQSEVFNTAVSKFNELIGTNDAKNFSKQMAKILEKDGLFFPTQGVLVPTVHGNLILSRDIVTGSYLGSDNKVQLVDNLGFGLDAGALYSIVGLPYNLGVKFSGGVTMQRLYSHVKPIESLKKAMREPYKNMLIPFALKKIGEQINKLSSVTEENQSLLIASILGKLKKSLGVGESFIITDSIGPRLGGELDIPVASLMSLPPKLLKVHASVQTQRMTLSRFHIHRPSKNVIQIYQDDARSMRLILSLKLSSYIPVLSVNGRWHKAKAQTKFYPVPLSGSDVTVKMLKALRLAFIKQNLSSLKKIIKPHVINHSLSEKANTLSFLFFKRNRIGANHSMAIQHNQGGEERSILRRYDSYTTGADLENFSVDVLNEVVASILEKDYALSSSKSINPGFTIKGRAKNKVFSSEYDGEYFHTKYDRILNGWSAKPKKLRRLIKKINREYGEEIINPLAYKNTNKILLYQIQLNSVVDHVGIEKLLQLTQKQWEYIFFNYSRFDLDEMDSKDLAERVFKRTRQVRHVLQSGSSVLLKKWHKLFKFLTEKLKFKGIMHGAGQENIIAMAQVDGFREGDEAGDSSILSDVYGELDVSLKPSPSENIMSKIRINSGELYLGWLSERAL